MIIRILQTCVDCGKQRLVNKAYGGRQSIRCQSCASKLNTHLQGADHPMWRGGRIVTTQGYICIKLQPEDFFFPMVHVNGYVFEHRLVMAKHLGRCLQPWELVHHKGVKFPKGSIENRQHNVWENLQLVTDDRHKQITILERKIARLEDINEELRKEMRLLRWQVKELTAQMQGNPPLDGKEAVDG